MDSTEHVSDHAEQKSTAATIQEQAAGIATTVQNSEVCAASAFDSVKNTQVVQDLANGPAATTIKNEANATSNEFSNLANSRKAPNHTAVNDTPLTHYHSFFFNLLSWENPRATGITFASVISFIFATRYLPVVSWFLKLTWLSLLVVTLTEVITKFTIGSSIATSMRPRKYFKIPKETLEATLDDVEQLINFFVIEAQRVVFAENLAITGAAFVAAFTSYYMIKLLPAWGFALFSTFVIFLVPLVYTSNKELIDEQLAHASNVVNEQTKQVQELAAQHTSKGLESVKQYAGDYGSVASDYIYKSRQKIPLPAANGSSTNGSAVKDNDFPAAPKTDLPASSAEHTKPLVTAPGEHEPIAASAS